MAFKSSDSDAVRGAGAGNYPLGSGQNLLTTAAWPVLWPLAAFALAALVIDWPWLSGRMTIPWDAKATFQPQIQFLAQSLAGGQSPSWAPFAFSGYPQIADPQAMIFSPPFLLLSLLTPAPSLWAVDATVLAMVFVGGAALLVWFRDQGWHWAGGLVAALTFAFGASMAWRIQHIGQVLSLAYLPLAMVCLDRALARGSILYGVAAGVVAAAIVLGRDQVALLVVYLLVGFGLWRLLSSERPIEAMRTGLRPLAAGAIAALVLTAIPVVLTALLAAQSNRPSIDFIGAGRGSLHPALLITSIIPEVFGASGRMEDYWGPPSFAWQDTGIFLAQNMGQLYVGAIPVILLILAALRGRLWAAEIRFFTLAAGLALIYALGWYTPVFRLLYEFLPGVGLYRRPADATFLIGALAAVLAGYSAHRLFKDPLAELTRGQVLAVLGVMALACAIAIGLSLWLGRLASLMLPLATAAISFAGGAAALAVARRRIPLQPVLAAAIISAFMVADLAYNNGPNGSSALPPETYDVLEPHTANATIRVLKSKVEHTGTRRDRIEMAGLGFHWPNAGYTHGLENTLGYNPVRLALYSAATGAEDTVGLPDQRKFSPLFPSYRSTLANLLGLRFIATGAPIETIDQTLKPGALPLVARTADGYIYENPAAMDRVLFATQAREADFERMLQDGVWPGVDLRSTVLLEHAPPASAPRPPGRVRILHYRTTEIVVEADSNGGGWVVLNDLWHPWWFVEVDGQPTDMLRANVLFRAVAVPPGGHVVRFAFRPVAGAWAELTGRTRRARHAMRAVHAGFSPAVPQGMPVHPAASPVSNPPSSVTSHER
ncbi:MAG: YfhO family protein [Hyphomonadaceae bacterium]|nr:YfhO family protein [Hyphomonadaceae bacterium]